MSLLHCDNNNDLKNDWPMAMVIFTAYSLQNLTNKLGLINEFWFTVGQPKWSLWLNLSQIDELWNWCHHRIVGAPWKCQAHHGGSMATLWRGTSSASSHQSVKSHWRNFRGESCLTRNLNTMNQFLRGVGRAGCWIGKIGEQRLSDPQS